MGRGWYDYDWLLERAYMSLPSQRMKKERFEMPIAKISFEKNKTIILNFKSIADYLNRDEKLLAKFLFKELATTGTLDKNRLILRGVIPGYKVNEKLRKFVQELVFCKECKCPDTVLIREKRILYLKCLGCGAKRPVKITL